VNFTVDQIRELMDKATNIRNISVIAHVDHGKSTLSDSLIAAAGIIAMHKAGDQRVMDTRDDEQERGITIKATAISLHAPMKSGMLNTLEMRRAIAEAERKAAKEAEKTGKKVEKEAKKEKKTKKKAGADEESPEEKAAAAAAKAEADAKYNKIENFLINLIDSPGHVDFSSEVTAALRVTDGAMVVVDCVEGVCVQTETVLRQAIAERIKPVLFVNKLDRVFLELMMEPEDCYQMFTRSIESVNVVVATYLDDLLGDVQVYPEQGTVGFGSGLQAWGFTLTVFARMYAAKFGVEYTKLMDKLWGNNFFDAKKNKWTTKQFNDDNTQNKRGFVQFILEPLMNLINAVMNNKTDVMNTMIEKLGIVLSAADREEKGKALMKIVMRTWIPASDALHESLALFFAISSRQNDTQLLNHGVHDVGLVVHNGINQVHQGLQDELNETTLILSVVIVELFGSPLILLGIKEVVAPQLVHELGVFHPELGSVHAGEHSQSETPGLKTRPETDGTLFRVDLHVTKEIIEISGDDDVHGFDRASEHLIAVFRFHHEFQEDTVELVHEQNGLDTLGNGLAEHRFGLNAHTFDTVDNDHGTIGDT